MTPNLRLNITELCKGEYFTRSQAVAMIADRTAKNCKGRVA